ncbi:hypothetical protein [Terriglobus saanensis]|uniref:Uncharacterized protein n=1 Tax=Terriglobus saanensis (strain ATCC BAA-1853 / DSM 23119 / SP1PR4) TaxID=401053 RepID=E8UYY4_TERSS|nr:hypothetical protein [Terriglobus saanensis]ADV80929.1 hypothetical protein AciPR4_0088 [Terriglobus saanensis SP1PR4]
MRQNRGAAMRRVGLSTVRALGQGAVTLKIPVAVATGGDTVQLGLVAPQFTDVLIAEAIVRAGTVEMPADTVHSALSLSDVDAVVNSLSETGGIVVGEDWFTILGVDIVSCFGEACLYRLQISPAK